MKLYSLLKYRGERGGTATVANPKKQTTPFTSWEGGRGMGYPKKWMGCPKNQKFSLI
jgi:hypothetical protein